MTLRLRGIFNKDVLVSPGVVHARQTRSAPVAPVTRMAVASVPGMPVPPATAARIVSALPALVLAALRRLCLTPAGRGGHRQGERRRHHPLHVGSNVGVANRGPAGCEIRRSLSCGSLRWRNLDQERLGLPRFQHDLSDCGPLGLRRRLPNALVDCAVAGGRRNPRRRHSGARKIGYGGREDRRGARSHCRLFTATPTA
jgi:hypothetical protein